MFYRDDSLGFCENKLIKFPPMTNKLSSYPIRSNCSHFVIRVLNMLSKNRVKNFFTRFSLTKFVTFNSKH